MVTEPQKSANGEAILIKTKTDAEQKFDCNMTDVSEEDFDLWVFDNKFKAISGHFLIIEDFPKFDIYDLSTKQRVFTKYHEESRGEIKFSEKEIVYWEGVFWESVWDVSLSEISIFDCPEKLTYIKVVGGSFPGQMEDVLYPNGYYTYDRRHMVYFTRQMSLNLSDLTVEKTGRWHCEA